MAKVEEIVANMRRNPKGIRFRDLCKVCDFYFGKARQKGSSHRIYKTPWPGDPRVNIQNAGGIAKAYQVRQVLKAIDRLETYSDAQE
jgi:predicted RNA binding protein YcfA (HicA-like mRNA interferase family)